MADYPTVMTRWGALPDVATLFPLPPHEYDDCPETGHCDWCDGGGGVLSPRNARLLHNSAEIAVEMLRADIADEYLEEYLELNLPLVCHGADEVWVNRFVECFDSIAGRIAQGEVPYPRCTGEEMALHIVLDHARDQIDDAELTWDQDDAFSTLPSSLDDGDLGFLRSVLFEDDDVLMLFNLKLDGIEDDAELGESMGFANLHPTKWFLPFRGE